MEYLGIFYDHLVYVTAIRNILWPFHIFCGNTVYFSPFWYVWTKKNLATLVYGAMVLLINGFAVILPMNWMT
jgi:hypothetical protein